MDQLIVKLIGKRAGKRRKDFALHLAFDIGAGRGRRDVKLRYVFRGLVCHSFSIRCRNPVPAANLIIGLAYTKIPRRKQAKD